MTEEKVSMFQQLMDHIQGHPEKLVHARLLSTCYALFIYCKSNIIFATSNHPVYPTTACPDSWPD